MRDTSAPSSRPLRRRAVRKNNRQQRSRQQQSPESNQQAQHNRDDQRSPDGHLRGSPHYDWLQDQSIHHDDRAVQSQHPEESFHPAVENRCSRRAKKCQQRPKVRNELEQATQNRPERSPCHMQVTQSDPPQQADADRVKNLRNQPTPQCAAGDGYVPGKLHNRLDARALSGSLHPCYTGFETPSWSAWQ